MLAVRLQLRLNRNNSQDKRCWKGRLIIPHCSEFGFSKDHIGSVCGFLALCLPPFPPPSPPPSHQCWNLAYNRALFVRGPTQNR